MSLQKCTLTALSSPPLEPVSLQAPFHSRFPRIQYTASTSAEAIPRALLLSSKSRRGLFTTACRYTPYKSQAVVQCSDSNSLRHPTSPRHLSDLFWGTCPSHPHLVLIGPANPALLRCVSLRNTLLLLRVLLSHSPSQLLLLHGPYACCGAVQCLSWLNCFSNPDVAQQQQQLSS